MPSDPPTRSEATADTPILPGTEAPDLARNMLTGALLIILAEFLFASMGAAIRVVSQDVPIAGVVFFRNLIGMGILLPLLAHQGLASFRTHEPHLHLLRGLAGLAAMYCFFYAIAHMPLAQAMLLKLSAPLFIPLVALAWLGERVPAPLRIAILVGFTGVTLILQPDPGEVSSVALIALLGGLFAAIAKVTVRRLSHTEPPARIVFYFALTGTLVSAVPLIGDWQTPSPDSLLWLLAVGALATLGQMFLTHGFALAPAAHMGTFGFFSVLFGTVYGWYFWDEILTWGTAAGSLLVLTAGILAGRKHPGGRNTR